MIRELNGVYNKYKTYYNYNKNLESSKRTTTITNTNTNSNHHINDNVDSSVIINVMLTIFYESIIFIIENGFVRKDIYNKFVDSLSKIYVNHGEKERFIRYNSHRMHTVHEDEIINKLRPGDYIRINAQKTKTLKQILTEYHDYIINNELKDTLNSSNKAEHNSGGDEFEKYSFFPQAACEREVILMTYICMEKWLVLSSTDFNLYNVFLSEYLTPLSKMEEILSFLYIKKNNIHTNNHRNNNNNKKKYEIPLLVNIMKWNWVIDNNEDNGEVKIFKSFFFFESFMVWFTKMCTYNFIDKEQSLYKRCSNFIKCLQFK
jgi:hypothetical protein